MEKKDVYRKTHPKILFAPQYKIKPPGIVLLNVPWDIYPKPKLLYLLV